MSRRNRRSPRNLSTSSTQVSLAGEAMELRQLLSVVNHTLTFKQITVSAQYDLPNPGYKLELDAVVVKGNAIHVFSTIHPPAADTFWPQVIVPTEKSLTVTVRNVDYDIEYHYGSRGESNTQLFHLLQDSSATAAYLNPESDSTTAWPRDDFEVAPTSPIDLSLRPGGPATVGFDFAIDAEQKEMTVWFDERASFTAASSNRHLRNYQITAMRNGVTTLTEFVTVMDEHSYEAALPGRASRQFGGRYVLNVSRFGILPDALQIRMRELPYFPEGATNTNALATEWSESVTHALPSIQHMNSVPVRPLLAVHDGKSMIEWLPAFNAASYEVWVKSVKGDKTVFQRSSIAGTQQILDTMLAPGDYRVWVRARRFDGSLSGWGLQQMTMDKPNIIVTPMLPTGDKTPTINWSGPVHAGSYIVRIVDEAREKRTESMRFASEADRINYITAYTATVPGNATEHEVAQVLPAGNYRAIVIARFTNNETTFSSSRLTIESSSLTTPVLSRDLSGSRAIQNTNPDSTSTGYEVWVAYLGREHNPARRTLDPQHGVWNFARTVSPDGRYELPATAAVGTYRVWMRATKTANPSVVSAWSKPVDLSHGTKVQSTGSTITWNPTRGAAGYQIDIRFGGNSFNTGGSVDTRPNLSFTTSNTSWTLPAHMDAGTYWVRVAPFFSLALATPLGLVSTGYGRVSHQPDKAWSWDVKFQNQKLHWTSVSDAVEYELEVTDSSGSKNVTVIPGSQSDTSGTMFANLPAGISSYTVRLRAFRRVNQAEGWTFWTPATAITTIEPATNIRLNGTIISWDSPHESGPFSIEIRQVNRGNMPETPIAIPAFWVRTPILSVFSRSDWTSRWVDLKTIFPNLFASGQTVEFDVSVQATSGNFTSATATKTISVEVFTADAEPIIERTAYSAPLPGPQIQYLSEAGSITLANLSAGLGSTNLRNSVTGTQWDVDQEFVVQWQLQLTNLQTGAAQVFDESQLGLLFQDLPEYQTWSNLVIRPGFPSTSVRLQAVVVSALFGTTGLYSLQARVRYLPVLLTAGKKETFAADFTPDDSNEAPRINVAPTPWSAWGDAFEYAVLPAGQSVLPWTQQSEIFNARPDIVWGVPLADEPLGANYEVWIENATTGERVVNATLTRQNYVILYADRFKAGGAMASSLLPWSMASNGGIMRFTPQTDLPSGTYHWWVRKVGDTGPRKGWSAKQTIEIVKAPVNVTMDAKTVDATPVISWQRASDAESYTIELRSVSSGAIVYSATEAANAVSHRVNSPQANGDYHVIVRALYANGGRSVAGRLADNGQSVPIIMTIGARVENFTVSQNRMNWQAVAGATRYQVSIQLVNSNGSVEKITDQDVFENSMELPSSVIDRPGEYRIWIRAIRNEAGHESTGFWSQRFVHHVPIASLPLLMEEDDFQLTSIVMAELATSAI